MAEYINCQVLDVGQGSGNLIEYYQSGTLTHVILIDLGSELAKSTAGAGAAKYIVDTLNSMATPTLDALILTHSDSDHVNLLGVLLDNFRPASEPGTKPILYINKIFYGGDRAKYKKHSTNYLTKAAAYLSVSEATGLVSFPSNATSYHADTNKWIAIYEQDNLFLYLVTGNTTLDGVTIYQESETGVSKLPDAYGINTKSLVALLYYKNIDMLITGDATGLTLAHCNQVLAKSGKLASFMTTLPHHASERTTFDLCGITTDDLDKDETAEQNLSDFVTNVASETISGSAERHRVFKHPSARVMSYFWDDLSSVVYYEDPALKGTQRHFYTAYFYSDAYKIDTGGMKYDWPGRSYWHSVQTRINIFTTLYFEATIQSGIILPPNPAEKTAEIKKNYPALGMQWAFTVDQTARKSVTGSPNRATLAEMDAIFSGHPLSEARAEATGIASAPLETGITAPWPPFPAPRPAAATPVAQKPALRKLVVIP